MDSRDCPTPMRCERGEITLLPPLQNRFLRISTWIPMGLCIPYPHGYAMSKEQLRFEMDADEFAEHERWTASRRQLMGESFD